MIHVVTDVLDSKTLAALRATLSAAAQAEAAPALRGWHESGLAVAERRRTGVPGLEAALAEIEHAVLGHPLFEALALPRRLARLTISRYVPGMAHARHVDEALIDGTRADCEFTLFLSAPQDYAGGAVVIEDGDCERSFRPAAGSLVLYPSTWTHRVETVTSGLRLAAVGWVRSLVRSAERREILADLALALPRPGAGCGASPAAARLARARTNLLRMWLDD